MPALARSPDITEAQLLAIMPRLQRHSSLAAWLQALNAAMAEYDITTPARRAAFLAQVAHETMELRIVEESWTGAAFQQRYEPPGELAKPLGNTEPGDGKRYRGRGLIQVTGRSNYASYGQLLGINLVALPDRANEPLIAARLAGAFWKQRGLNALADAEDFQGITRRINGGMNGLAERKRYLDQALAVLPP